MGSGVGTPHLSHQAGGRQIGLTTDFAFALMALDGSVSDLMPSLGMGRSLVIFMSVSSQSSD
jgi:hypothetical protein